MLGVPADFSMEGVAFVAGAEEEVDDGEEALLAGEVQGGVAFVVEVWVGEEGGVVAEDALDEEDVVEDDGSAEAGAGVDPGARGLAVGRVGGGGGRTYIVGA